MCCASGSWQRRHAHARAASVPRRAGRRTAEERSEGESKVEREHCGEDLALRRQALLPDQVRNHVCMVCGNVSVRCQGVLCNVDVAGSQGSDHVWRGSFRARLSRLKRWSLLPGREGPPHHHLLPLHASRPDQRAATLSHSRILDERRRVVVGGLTENAVSLGSVNSGPGTHFLQSFAIQIQKFQEKNIQKIQKFQEKKKAG